jgi:hypothetical protein
MAMYRFEFRRILSNLGVGDLMHAHGRGELASVPKEVLEEPVLRGIGICSEPGYKRLMMRSLNGFASDPHGPHAEARLELAFSLAGSTRKGDERIACDAADTILAANEYRHDSNYGPDNAGMGRVAETAAHALIKLINEVHEFLRMPLAKHVRDKARSFPLIAVRDNETLKGFLLGMLGLDQTAILLEAAMHGSVEDAAAALDKGADIDGKGAYGAKIGRAHV